MINLRDIDESNWQECIFLTTNKENKHYICEEFVASNALSIAQSKIENGWITKAIYYNDIMVGFTMYGYNHTYHFNEICRLMIDYKYQGKGYGKSSLKMIIEELKQFRDCTEIYLSFHPNNVIGKRLYESLNFKDTGKNIEGELLYKLEL